MFTLEVFTCIAVVLLVITVGTLIYRDNTIISDLQREKNEQVKENVILLENNRISTAKMSTQIIDLTERMTNLQNALDVKLEEQARIHKSDIDKLNDKVDTVLSMVMGCDNKHCPTRKKVSKYLEAQKTSE